MNRTKLSPNAEGERCKDEAFGSARFCCPGKPFSQPGNAFSGVGSRFSGPGISVSGLGIAKSGVGNRVSGVGITNSEGGISVSEGDFGVSGQEIADSGQKIVVSELAYRHKSAKSNKGAGVPFYDSIATYDSGLMYDDPSSPQSNPGRI